MKQKKKIVILCGIAVTLILLFWGAIFTKRESFLYAEQVADVEELMEEEKIEEALELMDEVDKEFGRTDRISKDRALIYMYMRKYEEAINQAEQLSDKSSMEYYSLKEQIYEYMGEEGIEELFDTYIAAANDWPEWTYMQKYAGIAQMERYNYGSAEAYFHQAYKQGKTDPALLFAIGALKYYQGDYEASVRFFQEAVDHELPIEMYDYVTYFLEQIKGEEME